MSLTPKQLSEIDQEIATYVDIVSISVKRLFDALLSTGFTRQEAIQMTSKAASDLMLSFLRPK